MGKRIVTFETDKQKNKQWQEKHLSFLSQTTSQPHTKSETSQNARNYKNLQKVQKKGRGPFHKDMYW